MASITAAIRTEAVSKMMGGKVGDAMRKELSLGVRDGLAILENDHKRNQVKRGGSSRAVSGTWTSRTGELSKSFHRDWKMGALEGAYGSDKERSRVIEEGGTIRAKNKYLAIPTENAPKKVWPRHVPGLFFITSKAGNHLLARGSGEGIEIMYILKPSVTLPPRPALQKAVNATENKREDRLLQAVDKALGVDDA